MRVISGQFKGKKLDSPINDSIRPTSDRIKESMFNILYSRLDFEGLTVLDLFCGSGALGIEAISRGADKVVFCDKSPQSMDLTRKNLANLSIKNFETYIADFSFALKKLENKAFDLIFIDPPYKDNLGNKSLELIEKFNVLNKNGIVVIEHDTDEPLEVMEKFNYESRKMGNTTLTFVKYKLKKDNSLL